MNATNDKFSSESTDRSRAGAGVRSSYTGFEEEGETYGEEGTVTKEIEKYTTYIPSGAFLGAAFGAMGISALLQLSGNKENAQFIASWVPTILIMGLYNKLVKLEGSSREEQRHTVM